MRQYQFKTINPNPVQYQRLSVDAPRKTMPIQQPPQIIYQPRISQPVGVSPHAIKNIKPSEQILSSTSISYESNTQSDQNLARYKRQLDQMMKQTEYIDSRKNSSAATNNPQMLTSNKILLDKNPKIQNKYSFENSNETRKYQNYQKNYKQKQYLTREQPVLNVPNKSSAGTSGGYEYLNKNTNPSQYSYEQKVSGISSKSFSVLPSPFESNKQLKIKLEQPNNKFGKSIYNTQFLGTEPIEKTKNNRQQNPFGTSRETYSYLRQSQNQQKQMTSQRRGTDTKEQRYNYQEKTIGQKQQKNKKYNKQSAEQLKMQNKKINDLQERVLKLVTQNIGLKQEAKNYVQNQKYYKSLIQIERKNVKQAQQKYEKKAKQMQKKYQQSSIAQKQLMNKQLQNIIQKNKQQIQRVKQQHALQIKRLQTEVEKKQHNIINLVKQIKEVDYGNSAAAQAQQLQQQQGNNRSLVYQVKQKDLEIENLNKQLQSRGQHINLLNQTLNQFKEEIQGLKRFKTKVQTDQFAGFDQILMTQMHTINELKQKIESMNQKTNQIRINLIESERRNESLENEIKILELKHRSEMNSMSTTAQIEMTNRDNTIGTLNKKMHTLEERLKSATNEIKIKDSFVKQHLVGRADSADSKQYIQTVLSKYKSTFMLPNDDQLRNELQRLRKQLQLYEKYA